MRIPPPVYLGDGVYASFNDSGQVVLTTGHHDPGRADNTIYLELGVLTSFEEWLKRLRAELPS
jgi:hypothetical protein